MVSSISGYLHVPKLLMVVFSYLTKSAVSFFSLFLPARYVKIISIFLKTLPRDLWCTYIGILIVVKSHIMQKTNETVLSVFSKFIKKTPKKICFYYKDEVWTFHDVDQLSDRIAHVCKEEGFIKGDSVALLMNNRPEYVCIWLGLAKLGVVSALINTNMRNQSLLHSIAIAKSKAIIFSEDLSEAVNDIRLSLENNLKLYQWGGNITGYGIKRLKELVNSASPKQFISPYSINYDDHLLYIYTSGTTGLPKAAIMPHSRFLMLALLISDVIKISSDDIIYSPLPLYHSAGGCLGVGVSLLTGGSTVLRTKFSATSYIADCIKYKCSVGQYIGEICRYMLAIPPKSDDQAHYLRMMIGNGLKPTVWAKFVERYNIPKIMEMYASTEGNLQFVNTEGQFGAVGYIPRFMPFSKYMGIIVKYDIETDTIVRNKDGFCIPCDVGEAGMFVGIIPWKNSLKEVHGYLDRNESSKKIIYNVFKKGDRAFVSGDLMVLDELGYLYFKDRTGDTFRWKGENVATAEVESAISSVIELRDCIVYGVEVGELEGRVGMAAIVDINRDLDLDNLAKSLDKLLPTYAHPMFIRILQSAELTGTFKLKKSNLQTQGFNPAIIKDPLYFRNGETYVHLTEGIYNKILSGRIRL